MLLGLATVVGGFLALLEFGRWTEVLGWGAVMAGAVALIGAVLFIVGDRSALRYADRPHGLSDHQEDTVPDENPTELDVWASENLSPTALAAVAELAAGDAVRDSFITGHRPHPALLAASLTRHADDTVTVGDAPDRILVTDAVAAYSRREDGTLVLDTAGQYRYRRADDQTDRPTGAHFYERITPAGEPTTMLADQPTTFTEDGPR